MASGLVCTSDLGSRYVSEHRPLVPPVPCRRDRRRHRWANESIPALLRLISWGGMIGSVDHDLRERKMHAPTTVYDISINAVYVGPAEPNLNMIRLESCLWLIIFFPPRTIQYVRRDQRTVGRCSLIATHPVHGYAWWGVVAVDDVQGNAVVDLGTMRRRQDV